jgi:DNA-binding MarR family transcriptional regulator
VDHLVEGVEVLQGNARALHLAVSGLVRWATRPEVRRVLQGATSGELLSATDVWLIDVLAASGSLRASELAEWQGVDRSTMTVQLKRLSDRGLIERQPDARDGRALLVGLSRKGAALQETLAAAGTSLFYTALSSWTAGDRRELVTLLARLVSELQDRADVEDAR